MFLMKNKKENKMSKKSAPVDTFLLAFQGELVEMIVDIDSSGKRLSSLGYVVDVDDNFVYLSSEASSNLISQAVQKSKILHCLVVKEMDEYEEMLDSIPTPKKKEGYN